MGFFSSKVNRSSTPAEKAFESGLSGESKKNYRRLNHDNAVDAVAETTPQGWNVFAHPAWGVHDQGEDY